MIPYVADQVAMARLPRSTYALLLSLLPVTATLCGLVVLGQVPSRVEVVGIALVGAGVAAAPAGGGPMSDMSYARVGSSGLVVSRLALGMMSFGDTSRRAWHLDADAARPLVRRAVEAGVTTFDTADMYDRGASEEVTGSLLRELFPRREDYVLATKVYYPMSDRPGDGGLSRRHILASIDASLRRLGHRPRRRLLRAPLGPRHPDRGDDGGPRLVVRAGKVRYLGASSMYAWQLAQANHLAATRGWHRFVAMQNHYHLAYREEEREMVPYCLDQGIGVLPYSPLARGLLTGTRQRGGGGTTTRSGNDPAAGTLYSDDDFDVVDALVEVAAELGRPPAQVALAWLRDRPGVVAPIVGSDQAAAPRGRARVARPGARRGGGGAARGAVPPARRGRPGVAGISCPSTSLANRSSQVSRRTTVRHWPDAANTTGIRRLPL